MTSGITALVTPEKLAIGPCIRQSQISYCTLFVQFIIITRPILKHTFYHSKIIMLKYDAKATCLLIARF